MTHNCILLTCTNTTVCRDVAKVFNRRKSSNDRWVLGRKAHSSVPDGTLYLGGSGGMPPQEILKMRTLGDAFSLILGAKSRGFRTDFYQVTGNKVMMNCSLD